MHIYRWDLDRTYLETEINSTRGLIKAAFERAEDKRAVPGAPPLVRGLLSADPEARFFVLSGSPRQMKGVISRKLALDGLRVDRLVLKDNLRNFYRGRLRAIRGQLAYKLPELILDRTQRPVDATETLFGDDCEVDPVIYTVYSELVAGRIDKNALIAVLTREGAYPDDIKRALRALSHLDHAEAVEDIFIRIDRGIPITLYDALGPKVHAVSSWWQAALVLYERERLPLDSVAEVASACQLMDRPSFLVELAQDAVRRGMVQASTVLATLQHPAAEDIAAQTKQALHDLADAPPRAISEPPDYNGFLDALQTL